MEKYQIRNFGLAALLLLTLAILSCSKDLDAPEPLPLTTGTLSASKSEVVIDMTSPDNEAIKFTWSAEKNTLVAYNVIFTVGSKSDSVSVAANTVEKAFSNVELNNILVDNLDLEIDKAASVSVQVHAKVTINEKEASSNVVTISATPAVKG
ncbi:SusE domain-containing protein [Parachryseolinea silvisoli]|uniref:SusE domain-containing protein n=1 Tax=Parachryseolinea silvisoli TaxID=2873601 RepID=UPI002265E6EA|nr:SusE domain-containing protein [Parachryseolinea silvisoli]MCD9019289.1 SusE domain-containing protein [Parachryseolinea silvisoli]